jgi:hypothetical protein
MNLRPFTPGRKWKRFSQKSGISTLRDGLLGLLESVEFVGLLGSQ